MAYTSLDIGLRIRALREANGYTREAFATRINISTKFLYEVESGKKGFSAETLYKISRALSTSSDYIMSGNKHDKIPEKILDILEGFSPDQMPNVQAILKSALEINTKGIVAAKEQESESQERKNAI